jgi:Transmembrane secretion effector
MRMGINGATMAGLALSGVTVAFIGAGWALALNAASFIVSALMLGSLRIKDRPRKATTGLEDLRHGWREFSSRQWLWVVVTQYAVEVAAANANSGVLGPLVAKEGLGGARAWALIAAAQALGTIAGAGLAMRIRVLRPICTAVLATFPTALPIALLAMDAPIWACAVAMFVSGVSSDIFGVLWATTMQREIPEDVLSRVSSYDWFGSLAFAPLGLMLAGPAATTVGTHWALAGCAALIVLATAGALLSPDVRSRRDLSMPVEDPAPEKQAQPS